MTAPLSSVVDQVLSRLSTAMLSPLRILVNRLLEPGRLLSNVARPPTRSQTETIFSNLQTPAARPRLDQKNAFRNTRQRSSATSAPRSLHVHTIFDPTSALTPTSGPLCAMSAPKPLPASMTGRDTKASTAARRNLCVGASLVREEVGGAAGDLRVRMPLAGISAVKLVESASSHCWTRKPWSVSAISTTP